MQQGGDDDALAAFRESAALTKALGEEEPANPLWPREESAPSNAPATRCATRATSGSDRRLSAELAIDQRLLQANPSVRALRGDDALKQETIGDALRQQADLVGALADFRTAMALRKGLADKAPDDRLDRQTQMIDNNQIASALAAQGDSAGALATFRESLQIARALNARADADADSRHDLAISLNGVGWMLTRSKDPAGAAQAFAEALPLVRALVQGEPSRAQYQRELWLIATNLGDANLAPEDRAGALAAYESGRDAAAALVALDKANATFASALHTSVDKIGFVANAMLIAGELQAALAALDNATPAAPDQNWLDLVRAACLMLLDRPDEARALYLKHRGETSFGGKTWETVATAGFAQMRARGISRPLMDEIEALFAAPK